MTINYQVPVLVVEDSPTILRVLHSFVRQVGFTDVTDASNGDVALDLLSKRRFELVIADWSMDVLSGYDLLVAVRNNPHLSYIPFILATANSGESFIKQAFEAGATGYITKPYDAKSLQAVIEKCLAAT